MPHDRFFSNEPFSKNQIIELKDSEFHHLKVMRIKPNDQIELINGKNQLATASLISIDQKTALLKIENLIEKKKKNEIILAISFLRQNKLDLILEKATELGVTQFFFFPSKNSELDSLSPNKKERMESILISAIKQSGRLDLPKISILKNIKEFESYGFDFCYGDINGGSFQITSKPICFFIGPEKGFTAEEVFLLENSLKAKSIKLNDNILRSETAAICAATLLSYLC